MKYGNQLSFGTVYNFDEEYRPKLFKRLRTFVWEEAIHETIRTQPIVFDSDVVITHMPTGAHGDRDLRNFEKQIVQGKRLSKRLQNMYARELLLVGSPENIMCAQSYFEQVSKEADSDEETLMEAYCILVKSAFFNKNLSFMMKYALKAVVLEGCSEICVMLGNFYEEQGDLEEAILWYCNAAYQTQPVLVKKYGHEYPLEGLIRCYEGLGMEEQAKHYEKELAGEI